MIFFLLIAGIPRKPSILFKAFDGDFEIIGMSEEKAANIPSEFRLNRKWDQAAFEFAWRPIAYGTAAALFSVVLFRSGSPRRANFAFLGVGAGLGDAYRVSVNLFDSETGRARHCPTQLSEKFKEITKKFA